MRTLASLLLLLLTAPSAFADEVVAYRADTPILRSQLAGDMPEDEKLIQLTVSPAVSEYLLAHRAEWEPDEATLDVAVAALRRSLACLPYPTQDYYDPATARFVASAWIGSALAQRFIHRRFGGGRLLKPDRGVLFPGVVAFDATSRWVHQLESDGAFRIVDPTLRNAVFAFFSDTGQGTLVPESEAEALLDPEQAFITCEPETAANAR